MKDDKDVQTQGKNAAPRADARQGRPAPKHKIRRSPVQARTLAMSAAVVAVAALLAFVLLVLPSILTVPFATFKANFGAAPRVAFFVAYGNQSQFSAESSCYTSIIHSIALSRNATTIDFFILNGTTCTFSSTGLGGAVNISTEAPAQCVARVASEPAIFLNYSAVNRTLVKAYGLYVYGNSAYMARCPIAVDIA